MGRKFAKAFKCEAVELVTDRGVAVARAARDLDLTESAQRRWTREGWIYRSVIIDLFSRRVVGWAISNRMKQDLALRALNMAIAIRRPPPRCIHHTDRGSQYCAHECQKLLRKHGVKISMSVKGNCYDTSAVDSYFKSVKAELVWAGVAQPITSA